MARSRRLSILAVMLLAMSSLGAACGEVALSIMPGLVNDPSNRSLRRAIFGFATGELCKEMRSRSIPLKMRDVDPAIGRFFPTGCAVKELESGNLLVQFTGHGYAWTNVTQRMGFEAAASVEYAHDFLMQGSTMYVYFRERDTQSKSFTPLMVQVGGNRAATGVVSLLGGNVQTVAKQIGERVLKHQLARGFTVVRESDGASTFSLGVLDRGSKPLVPFSKGDSDWKVLSNDRVELHAGQRDFAGPFHVSDADEALYVTMLVEGAPSVDLLVFPKNAADPWIQAYERNPAPTAPPVAPLLDEVVAAPVRVPNRPRTLYKRMIRTPPGDYYVVFDQTATAGRTPPTPAAAHVSYAVQLGDAP